MPGAKWKNPALESLQREIAILKKVDHPNIVRMYEVCYLWTSHIMRPMHMCCVVIIQNNDLISVISLVRFLYSTP